MDLMGLGIRLDLQDNMTRQIDPLIRRLEELEEQSRQTANSFNQSNTTMFGSHRRRNIQDYVSSMGTMDVALNRISRTLISATASASRFAQATNRMQFTGNFSRMYGELTRVNMMLGRMGYGMSRLQREMSDTRAYNMLNYQLKDLQDRIKLTSQAIKEMQNAPNSSQFREQIALAQQSLRAYQSQLQSTSAMQQQLARTHGLRTFNAGGSTQLMQMPDTMRQRVANRLLGLSMLDVAHSSNFMYQSLSRTANLLTGMGYTTMEARQKLTQLSMSMQMTGQALSMYLTAPILAGAMAWGVFAQKFEQAQNLMQARTLVNNSAMNSLGGFNNAMGSSWIDTGADYQDVGKTFATIKNYTPNLNTGQVKSYANAGLLLSKTWGTDAGATSTGMIDLVKKYGMTSAQAMDIYTLALRRSNGDLSQANKYINNNIGALKRMTAEGTEGAKAFERMSSAINGSPMERFAKGLRSVADTFRIIWQSGMGEVFGKIGDGLYKMSNGLNSVLQHNPALAKFLGYTLAITGAILALAGPAVLVTSIMVRYRNIIQGVGHALFGLSKGGFAVLSPQARLASENMRGFLVSFARFPNTLLTAIPLLYNVIRGLPILVGRLIMMNPLMSALGFGLLAYSKNWWGLKDTVNGYIDKMKEKWKELVKAYKNSDLPDTLKRLKDYAKEFGKGFFDGLGVAVDIGKQFVEFVLTPIKEIASRIDPVLTSVANSISKIFGGKGDMKEGAEKWRQIGKFVGVVVGGLLAIKGITSVSSFLLSPFVRMNSALMRVTSSVDRLITRMGILGRVGLNGLGSLPSRIAGGVVGGARRFGSYMWNRPNPALGGQAGLIQRTGSFIMSPFTATRSFLASRLASMGIGNGIAMGRQMQAMRQAGAGIRNNPAFLNMLRSNGFTGNAGISATGLYNGRQVMLAQQSALSRALFGQKLMTYSPVRDPITGAITGYQRNDIGRTGGLFRRSTSDLLNPNGRSFGQRLVTGAGTGLRSMQNALMSSAPMLFARGMANNLRNRITSPFSRMTGAVRGFGARGFDRLTQNRFARGLGGAGRWMGSRLQMAGVRNPFAGALNRTGMAGPMTRGQVFRNFAGRTLGGAGSLAMAGAGMMGRGALRGTRAVGRAGFGAVRMAGRGVGMVGRGFGRAMGGLMGMAPWLIAGGLIGKVAYDKLGVGKDGKKSVANVAGNLDKITAGIGKGGSKGITEFWNKFKKYGGDIIKAVGRLISASLKALAPKIPGMLKDAWHGVVGLAKWAWNWIKTDGVKMATATGKGLMSILGSAWKWIKTDGVKLLGQLWEWFINVAVPKTVSIAMKLLGKLWDWFKTDGIKLIGSLVTWVIGTAIPNLVSGAWKLLGKVWTWFITDGYKQLWSLVKGVGTVALEIGKAIFNGIKSALSGLGSWIGGLIEKIPGGSKVMEFLGGGKKKHARGGILSTPHMGMVAEDGAEAIIPLTKKGYGSGLLKQTASILGYDVVPQGQENPYATRSNTNSFINQSNSQPLVRNAGKSGGSTDNSFKIDKVEIKLDTSSMPNGKADIIEARKQAQLIMKEFRKIVIDEKSRSKGKSFEEILLSYT